MKKLLLVLTLVAITSLGLSAQSFSGMDKSPLDVSYLPDRYAHDQEGELKAKIYYSRPQKKDRDLFGSKIKFGKVWRLGANEACELVVYKDLKIAGKTVKPGTYSVFAIPNEKEWTIIINKDTDYWGAYSYKESNDVVRASASVKSSDSVIEALSIQFDDKGNGSANMHIGWDKTIVSLPIGY